MMEESGLPSGTKTDYKALAGEPTRKLRGKATAGV